MDGVSTRVVVVEEVTGEENEVDLRWREGGEGGEVVSFELARLRVLLRLLNASSSRQSREGGENEEGVLTWCSFASSRISLKAMNESCPRTGSFSR